VRCFWSRTSTGSWRAGACSRPSTWPPTQPLMHCRRRLRCRRQPLIPRARETPTELSRLQAWRKQPVSPCERLDKSSAWIHCGERRCICASGITRCHSTLLTLRSGQSGLGFYTTRRDAACRFGRRPYQVLHTYDQVHRRGRTRPPQEPSPVPQLRDADTIEMCS